MTHRLFCLTDTIDDVLWVFDLNHGTAEQEARWVKKTEFELSRRYLENSDLSGEALDNWQRNLHFDDYTGSIPFSSREVAKDDFPTDKYFRRAWEDNGSAVVVNMSKARTVHLTEIRRVRDAELTARDIPWMKAVEAGDTDAQTTIGTEKQVLRDIPATFDLTTEVDTPEKLKAKWPAELPARE
jgi:hypothetical protein